MSAEQRERIVESLVSFVIRVSAGEKASPAEVAALPEIVKVLCEEGALSNGVL